MMKYKKIPSKMFKQISATNSQQKEQQKVHNIYVAFLIKQFVFTKLMESLY